MTKLILTVAFLAAVGVGVLADSRIPRAVESAICTTQPPLGGIAPQVPEWCNHENIDAVDTHHEAANAWVDDFNHGESHKELSSVYAHGKANGAACDIIHFSHNNHWMADIQGDNGQWPTLCAAWMRPDRTFRPDSSGKVIIEFEVASPIAGTRDAPGLSDAWPEFTLSTDPSPGNLRQNGTYIYETMAGHWTFGCRMQQSKHPICALYQPADGPPAQPYRRWEINQNGGDVASDKNGGPATGALAAAWVGCTSIQDPDTVCRNKHRVEITATTIKFFVNGVEGYSAVLMNNELGNVLNAPGGFYVYFGDFAYRISQDVVVRFHWDRLAINPHLFSGTEPTPTVTSTPTATRSPVPTSTSMPTATPTVAQTSTPTPPTATPTLRQCRVQQRIGNSWVTVRTYQAVVC